MEQTNEQKLALALLTIFMGQAKAGTSWKDKHSFYRHLEDSGFNGIFTGLDRFFTADELAEVVTELWDNFN